MSRSLFVLAALALASATVLPHGSAGREEKPSALDKSAPENVADLRDIQKQVKRVIKDATPAVVAVQVDGGQHSGAIVAQDGLVLTAGHVSGKPGRACVLILPDGKKLKGKTLGQNRGTDCGMIQIIDEGKYPFLKTGDSSKVNAGDWVIALGHPNGYAPSRKVVARLGRVSKPGDNSIESSCTLVGGDTGGPLLDVWGNVIGIHSRIGPPITENVHAPLNAFKRDWDKLVKGESWGSTFPFFDAPPANAAYLGVSFDRDGDLTIDEVRAGTAAATAGLKEGDVIVGIDDTKVKNRDDLFALMKKKQPGDKIIVVFKRGAEEKRAEVKLGERPE